MVAVFRFHHASLSPVYKCAAIVTSQALAPHLQTSKVGSLLCGPSFKVEGLAELTKLAQQVIVKEQLEEYIKATVDTSVANYAIVSPNPPPSP